MRKEIGLALVLAIAFAASPMFAASLDAAYFEDSGTAWSINDTGVTDISSVSTRWNYTLVNGQSLYNATSKSGGFGALVYVNNSWMYSPITSSGSYVASASSAAGNLQVLVAKENGGVEYWSKDTGVWAGADTGITGQYTSLASRGLDVSGRVLAYATRANGGIDHLVYTGTQWVAAGVITSSQVYNSIAGSQGAGITDNESKQYLASKADGGVDYVYWDGSSYALVSDVVSGQYLGLGAVDALSNGKVGAYATRADGGIDLISFDGSNWGVDSIIDDQVVYGAIAGGVNYATAPSDGAYSGFAVVVPEPATMMLISAGGLSVLLKRRRK